MLKEYYFHVLFYFFCFEVDGTPAISFFLPCQGLFLMKKMERIRTTMFQFQFFTLNLKNSDKKRSRGVDCDRADLD